MSEHKERAATDEAFVAFVERTWNHHLRVARLLTGDPHRAEDLLQDCLVTLYQRWRQVSRRGDPQAYLRRMLANGNVSWWRRRRRENLVAESPDRSAPDVAAEPHEELRRALLALPRQQRAVVVLRHYADLGEKEVAATLGCSVGTVKTHHFRALAKLRDQLTTRNDQGVTA